MSRYGDGDGNLYSLDKYLDAQDKKDMDWEQIIKDVQGEVEESTELFSNAMNKFHSVKEKIAEALKDCGMADDDEVVMQIMYDCGDNDLLEQLNTIDW